MTKKELLELLNNTKAATVRYFDCNEHELNKNYGEGKWTVRQILHHLTDTENLFMGRLKKIIAEPKQVIWAFNPDEWSETFQYRTAPLTGKKELYSLCREMNYQLIDRSYEQFAQKEFVHNQLGLRTLLMEFEKVGLHNLSHLNQIETALAR
jgi:uncharacterized damage-inducible protein DinB